MTFSSLASVEMSRGVSWPDKLSKASKVSADITKHILIRTFILSKLK
jgi:hypothetical protein